MAINKFYLPLYIIFSLPLISSFYYSYDKNIIWLLNSLLCLSLISIVVLVLTAKFSKKWIAFGTALLFLLPIYIFEIIQLVPFYLQGEGFNDRFFFHFTFNSIQEAWTVYPFLTITIILIILIFIAK
jgi:hypothetical protein